MQQEERNNRRQTPSQYSYGCHSRGAYSQDVICTSGYENIYIYN